MLRKLVLAGVVAMVASNAMAAEPMVSAPPMNDHDSSAGRGWAATGEATAWLAVGDPAPAFSYVGADGTWRGFRELIAAGPVVLVFGAREPELEDLDRARQVFSDLGVRIVLVMDRGAGSSARLARRLGLENEMISDAQCAIGGLYGSLNPSTRRHATGYFVLDEKGTLRGYGRGTIPPSAQLIAFSARCLGRPLPESAWSLSKAE